MKPVKTVKPVILLTIVLAVLLCSFCFSYADEEPRNGFYGIGTAADLTISPQNESGDVSSVSASYGGTTIDNYYPDTDRLSVSLSGVTEGKEYAVFLLDSEAESLTPDAIYYINQTTAAGSSVSFNVYPKTISVTTDLKLKITSNDGTTAVEVPVSFKVWETVAATKLTVSAPGSITDGGDTEVVVAVEPANASVDFSVSSDSGLVTAQLTGSDGEGNYTFAVHADSGASGVCTLTFTDVNSSLTASASMNIVLGADAVDMKGVALSHSIVTGKYVQFKSAAYRTDGKKVSDTAVVYLLTDADGVPLEETPAGVTEMNGKFTFRNAGIYYVLISPATPSASCTPQFVTVTVTPVLKSLSYLDDANKKLSKLTLVAGDDAEPYDLGARASIVWSDGLSHEEYRPVYSSSNDVVAVVDEDGLVTPVSSGTAKIEAVLSGKKVSISVTVGVGADTLNNTMTLTQSIAQGKTLKFKVAAARADGVKPISTAVSYTFADEYGEPLAELPAGAVISKGSFKASVPGTYYVLVTADSAVRDAQSLLFTINVSPILKSLAVYDDNNKKVSKLTMSSANGTFDLLSHLVHVWTNPETDDDEFFKPVITSSDEDVVRYDSDNGQLISNGAGKATVTIALGGKTAKLSITAGFPANEVINSYMENKVVTTDVHTIAGKSVTLKAAVFYNGQTPIDKTFTCVSSDESVATVSKGKVKAAGAGVCTVTVMPTLAAADCQPLVYTIYVYPSIKSAGLTNPDTGKTGTSLAMETDSSELGLDALISDILTVTWKDGEEHEFLDEEETVPAYEIQYSIKKGPGAELTDGVLYFNDAEQVTLDVTVVSGSQKKKLTLTLNPGVNNAL